MTETNLNELSNADLVKLLAELEALRKQIALILSKRVHEK
jgi:hypothetical protein